MEEKNELNDILLKNKDNAKDSNLKNILLFSAITLLIFFIGVLAFKMISTDNTKQPQDEIITKSQKSEELFEDVPIKEEIKNEAKDSLDEMIRKIKESKEKKEEIQVVDTKLPPALPKKEEKKEIIKSKVESKQIVKPTKKIKQYYIQAASLSKFEPNKKFLATITNNNYTYKIVTKKINGNMIKRVYIGPFKSSKEATRELMKVHEKISDKAFVIKD